MSMLKLESFFFFSFFLFLAGCGNQSKPVSVEQEIITPLSAGNAVDDLLPYIDSVEVVPLETTGKALIGLVGKILLLPNGNVLIKSTASMFMFSPEGKFLFQIGNKNFPSGLKESFYFKSERMAVAPKNTLLSMMYASARMPGNYGFWEDVRS